MAVYTYTAGDIGEQPARGTVVADTPRQARDQLRQRGLSVYELAEHTPSSSRPWRFEFTRWSNRSRRTQVTEFVRELSTLLAVGMPMLEALDVLARQQKRLRPVLLSLHDRVAAGVSLADAMRQQPQVFDAITISMTEVGENAGTLDQVFEQLADFQQRSAQMKGKIGAALLYPAIILSFSLIVSLFLMTYVVPKLLDSLLEAGKPLPAITQIVKGTSDLLLQHGILLTVIFAAVVLALSAAVRTRQGRWLLHRGLLKCPVLGDLLRKQAVVRISFVTATLMRSGIAFEQAIAIAQRSAANVVLRQALEKVEAAVRAGRDIAVALEQTDVFPQTVVQVFALGQQSGRLEDMLERLASDYDRQVAASAARLTALLEPALILLLAIIIGAIAFATILPILEIGNVL